MSSRAQVAVLPPLGRRAPRPGASTVATIRERPALRVVAFAAFGLYGTLRWASMLHPQPTWRSLGMLAVATVALPAVAVGSTQERRVTLKKLEVRKLGPIRMTSAVIACYIQAVGCTGNCGISM